MIICAAIRFHILATGRDVTLCGLRHGDCFSQLADLGFNPRDGYLELEQGFVTHTGEFLDRFDAFIHAKECGQMSATTREEKRVRNESQLYSEDLW